MKWRVARFVVSTSCKQDLGRPLKRTPNFSCDAVIRDEFSSEHLISGPRKVNVNRDFLKCVQTVAQEFKNLLLELKVVLLTLGSASVTSCPFRSAGMIVRE